MLATSQKTIGVRERLIKAATKKLANCFLLGAQLKHRNNIIIDAELVLCLERCLVIG